ITVESAEYKLALAAANFERANLASIIRLVHDDAASVLQQTKDGAYDFVFLDADRAAYVECWAHLRRVIRPGGLLVVDNATSHCEEMAPFVAKVEADARFVTSLVPIGNGEFLAVKNGM